MINTNTVLADSHDSLYFFSEENTLEKLPRAIQNDQPEVLTHIYQEMINIAVWQRELSLSLKNSIDSFIKDNPVYQVAMTVAPQNVIANLNQTISSSEQSELIENIAELVDMFCCLFELRHAGLRLTVLNNAMCPKFHVDRVPCRLVSTYRGMATQWLPDHIIDRTKLGAGSNGNPDHESGLYLNEKNIQKLEAGDVALLKGELWENNENAGLVHRSPILPIGESRLLLTLDFIN
ncbi:DUF1826 domain-containing protein [Aliikangiella maris]|uniref:DUF1826 domain-containing protein n=2 Tax=Aliikangiella maris TaxID=3162458 RepID=A0ABV2BZ51_9GAMM